MKTIGNMKATLRQVKEYTLKAAAKTGFFAPSKQCRSPRRMKQTVTNDVRMPPVGSLTRSDTYSATGAPRSLGRIGTQSVSQGADGAPYLHMVSPPPQERPKVTTWTFECENVKCFFDGAPRLVLVNDGMKECVAVLPDVNLSGQLRDAIMESRAVDRAEKYHNVQSHRLYDRKDSIERSISEVEAALAKLGDVDTEEQHPDRYKMEEALVKLRRQLTRVEEQRKLCHRSVESQHKAQRSNLLRILNVFEDALLEGKALPPQDSGEAGDKTDQAPIDAGLPDLGSYESDEGSEMSDIDPETQDIVSRMLQRKPAIGDLKLSNNTRGSFGVLEAAKAKLIRQFQSTQMRLEVVQQNFDTREAQFDDEAEERGRKLDAGEDVECDVAFDMRQLETTRRMARQIIEAEEALAMAKKATVAAGVQLPGSELESGFVDDVDDGYRISWDEGAIGAINPEFVQNWMQEVPEEDTEEPAEADVDDWAAETVGLSDSASMIAEGPARQRIDKWWTMCAPPAGPGTA